MRTVFIATSLLLMTQAHGVLAEDEVTVDRALETRLTDKKVYATRSGDSLVGIAYLVYGHRSWWKKLVAQNPGLKKYRKDQSLPKGIKIHYLGPALGKEYVVKENDWLIRIALWKYGSTEQWEEIFSKNSGAITDPDLIYPGDKLFFGEDGTIRTENRVILRGVAEVKKPPGPEPFFLAGLALGLFIVLFLPGAWYLRRRTQLANGYPNRRYSVWGAGASDTMVEDEGKRAKDVEKGYPYTFNRRPAEEPSLNKALFRKQAGNIIEPSAYVKLTEKLRVNLLKLRRKK